MTPMEHGHGVPGQARRGPQADTPAGRRDAAQEQRGWGRKMQEPEQDASWNNAQSGPEEQTHLGKQAGPGTDVSIASCI